MRLMLGVLSLLIALLVSGLLVKSRLAVKLGAPVSTSTNTPENSPMPSKTDPILQTQGQQIRQLQDKVRQSVETAMQGADKLNGE